MADDLCRSVQKVWQGSEQNQARGRGRLVRHGSDHPKPRAGWRQTAQSS
jgi:hypothetical protein